MRFSSALAALAIVFSGAIASAQQYNMNIYNVSWTVMQDDNYSVTVSFNQDREEVRLRRLGSFGDSVYFSVSEALELSRHLTNVEDYLSQLDEPNAPERLTYDAGDAYLSVSRAENGGRNIFVNRRESFGGPVTIRRETAQIIGEHLAMSEQFLAHLRSKTDFE